MKYTPIEPKHIGCACCSSVGQKLSKEKWLDVGFGSVDFLIAYSNGKAFYRSYVGGMSENEDKVPVVKDLVEEYGDKFKNAECITLFFNTPLHDETYEYNKDDGEWYLIKQGMGFA